MAGEDNWQTKLPTLVERTAFIFNNEILSDVKFVVPVSIGESESKKVIPAHKFVTPCIFKQIHGVFARREMRRMSSRQPESIKCVFHSAARSEI